MTAVARIEAMLQLSDWQQRAAAQAFPSGALIDGREPHWRK